MPSEYFQKQISDYCNHNGILLSHKKDKIMPLAATWIQLEILILSEISEKEKDKYHMISLLGGI